MPTSAAPPNTASSAETASGQETIKNQLRERDTGLLYFAINVAWRGSRQSRGSFLRPASRSCVRQAGCAADGRADEQASKTRRRRRATSKTKSQRSAVAAERVRHYPQNPCSRFGRESFSNYPAAMPAYTFTILMPAPGSSHVLNLDIGCRLREREEARTVRRSQCDLHSQIGTAIERVEFLVAAARRDRKGFALDGATSAVEKGEKEGRLAKDSSHLIPAVGQKRR